MTRNHSVEVTRGNGDSLLPQGREISYLCPATDVFEAADAYLLLVDMPGAGKESISVTVNNNALVVKGVVGPLHTEKPKMLRTELRTEGYYREFNVGDDVDRRTVEARYEEGVLAVKLFKKEETRPRQISIN